MAEAIIGGRCPPDSRDSMIRPRNIWAVLIWSSIAPAPFLHAAEGDAPAPRQMERLGRGTIAVRGGDGGVFVSWRLLGTDPAGIAFDLYRSTDDGPIAKLNRDPIAGPTGFVDAGAEPGRSIAYTVRPAGRQPGPEPEAGATFRLAAQAPAGYLAIPLRTPDGYAPNDASVGDLDGDGQYEIILHQALAGPGQLAARSDRRADPRRLPTRRDLPLADQPGQECPRGGALYPVPGLRPRRRRPRRDRLQDRGRDR